MLLVAITASALHPSGSSTSARVSACSSSSSTGTRRFRCGSASVRRSVGPAASGISMRAGLCARSVSACVGASVRHRVRLRAAAAVAAALDSGVRMRIKRARARAGARARAAASASRAVHTARASAGVVSVRTRARVRLRVRPGVSARPISIAAAALAIVVDNLTALAIAVTMLSTQALSFDLSRRTEHPVHKADTARHRRRYGARLGRTDSAIGVENALRAAATSRAEGAGSCSTSDCKSRVDSGTRSRR